ncbi:unconventional myosin-IXa-like isoform X1 [Eupeodes corollae]|uniref:unconventional myosin-IXa-like isoform X1 n=1 Tax=Eupeodes corollae TaxID=290404 RepID=UPI002490EC22|nr:unconventional myosin-IXa-like isoform X1 [Eupeodes corollae]XP_055911616.1 unconventional myosin-IXa-like isoform X1 [Eupeodes corollae]XP_055911617.1 unconventional myosin-IXa-like isoform X1 [Eupeodes corollae]XP_055911618.1 unconventional myosin-IXa-like isoform X1 [Eupeodes corollae]XP_055911619.1 unconventional myosin-IXa-like isoform X1 [Eupeodes corollae]XP_055911620.1 unconventional myosin-IXa-like isoform X1 [Eupeodes corollae]XP_055911621.1 unconventional myosin-IXa-like isoform
MQSIEVNSDCSRYILQVYVGALSLHYEALSVEASKQTTAEEIVSCIVERLGLLGSNYELAEVAGECKERRLAPEEKPVSVMLLWPMHSDRDFHRFYLRESQSDITWLDSYGLDSQIFRDFIPFLLQPENREYPDLCQLPDLNESTLLENLRQRFEAGYIYTYVGSILIAVNPFKFYPIYNPKYVRLYQNQRIGPILPPHIFAIADNAYYSMLKENRNQCIVISGESGSGKTESTNFLLHHLTALSQKGSHGSGVEQTILSAGPVLEAFGNAKTAHNNNSSRFGKFIQVNYRENGMVQGAIVQKYLLEKSRIVSQGPYERNYHVFYYLLSGATDAERESLYLLPADKYNYLNSKNLTLENCNEKYEFSRLKQSMEMVGFSSEKQRRLFNVLSAVLLLGNVEFFPKKSTYHHDESVQVRNLDVVAIISELLKVKQDTLLAALTSKRVKASGETLIMQYKLPEAIAARDALAKCLYGALFDWIVLQVNHALLNKDQTPHTGHSIGVLDIFGFEDFGPQNSFEQLCINYANEHLQYYFNLHVFKYEQNEYKREDIKWSDIEFMDNSGCLHLFESKPTGLLCILDDLCNFPGATNETLLQKFNSVHKDNKFYEKPQRKENAFIIKHYAGKVKYQVAEMREKNLDLMRQDIVSVLKNSSMAFVRELVGADPVAVFRWAIIRAFFRSYFAFRNAGSKHRKERTDYALNKYSGKNRYRQQNDIILSKKSNIKNELPNAPNHLPTNACRNTRRSWSSIAFNNKNFPDGKLVYESSQAGVMENSSNKLFSKNYSRFERSSQEVMAKASQIVQKNKSFRPRERPKKGLKNLQTVKMMTAGTNLFNQTGIKTRKQPLTVTAQFQNSLTALMDTLNQANPFFIRCIKSNAQKIPNKFDETTVVRQLRYTGMLETVRIRRAGYNVRLTYEEFIQLYRILLPKGLVSSQKDVKDFLSTMDLNKQHYQLGATKIYMRESQKMRLDIKLHTKIIDSIVLIQRWFRGILQRNKFLLYKRAALTIQSYWRMTLAQEKLTSNRQRWSAAVIIQSYWKMYKQKTWYHKLRVSIVIVQAHSRGTIARLRYRSHKMRLQKERSRLRCTQSLPSTDRTFSELYKTKDVKCSYQKPHHSLDSEFDEPAVQHNLEATLLESQNNDVLQKAGNQLRNLMILSGNNNRSIPVGNDLHQNFDIKLHLKQNSTDNIEKLYPSNESAASFIENNTANYKSKTPLRKTDSGPTNFYNMVYEEIGDFDDILDIDIQQSENPTKKDFSLLTKRNPIEESSQNISDIIAVQQQQGRYHASDSESPQKTISEADAEINSNYSKPYENVSPDTHSNYKLTASHHQSSSYSQKHYANEESNSPSTTQASITAGMALPSIPKGKAATLLGSISEDQVQFTLTSRLNKQTKSRRVKSNLSDELGSVEVVTPRFPKLNDPPAERLRRRNSDPSTNKVPLLEVNRGNDMYQSSTQINIAGHRFRKAARIGKAEKCASCQESDAFVNEGYRCLDCKVLVHTKCIQNGGVKTLICEAKRSKRLRKSNDKTMTPNSKYSAREYTDSTDRIISDAKELNLMQDFITQKIYKMDENEGEKTSEVDRVFKKALRAFKDNLVTQYSVAHKQNSDSLNIKYRDLIDNFGQVMETCCGKQNDFPLTMGVNAFRGFMNEFMNSRETEKPKAKRKKEKKRKIEEHTNYHGHAFQLTIINIPTACEICQLFLLWPIERGLVCQNCRLTCHKKCYQKSSSCNKTSSSHGGCVSSQYSITDSKLFGVPLTNLCLAEGAKIPIQIEQLITKIEMLALYTEGIYRKSGVNSKIRELKQKMSETPIGAEIDYESYNVHVLANVLKSFLREMPEPLLSFDRYDDFLRASDLPDTNVRVQTLLSLIKKLSASHHFLLERLIFHLALVAQKEKHNRMSASSLSIVFAPCVLRTNRLVPAQDSLNDICRQTKCIETLITQKMLNVKSTLADIDTLDTAAHTATTRLSTLRSSKVFAPEELTQRPSQIETETEEMILEGHIQEIRKEKALLTSALPNLIRTTSDDDLLSTDLDGEGGSLDDLSTGKEKDSHSLAECKDFKDSIDSSFGSLSGDNNISRKGLDEKQSQEHYPHQQSHIVQQQQQNFDADLASDSIVLSYNLRDQNIDYISSPRHHVSLDHEMLSSGYAVAKNYSSTPKSSTSNNTSNSLIYSGARRSGSQQNLSYSMVHVSATSAGPSGMNYSASMSGKPLAVRSMSSGYDATTTHLLPNTPQCTSGAEGFQLLSVVPSSSSSAASPHVVAGTSLSASASLPTPFPITSSNKGTSIIESGDIKSSRKKKKQESLDDEPIMV